MDMKRDSSLRLFGDFKKSRIQTNTASEANTEYLCYVQYYLVGEIIVFFFGYLSLQKLLKFCDCSSGNT